MKNSRVMPPYFMLKFFRWFCNPRLADHIEGDLIEVYCRRLKAVGKPAADLRFMADVLLLMRPGIIRSVKVSFKTTNIYDMLKSYFRMSWRTIVKNKGYAMINIGGLAIGMAVVMLISLWAADELSFDRSFENYDRISKVWQFVKFGAEKSSYDVVPVPLAEELRTNYPDFEAVSMSKVREITLSVGDKKLMAMGNFVEPSFIDIFSVKLSGGSLDALKENNSIFLSQSLAKNIFGRTDPLNSLLVINGGQTLNVAGVYEDFPASSTLKEVSFLISWNFLLANDEALKNQKDEWDSNGYNIYALLKEGANVEEASLKIRDVRIKRGDPPAYRPEFFLHPMSKWHLYSDFKDGKNTGGTITYVRLFGLIGTFVLVLACINFMNLATARSEKRAKEVGIRKSIGSIRIQLVFQFLTESLIMVGASFLFALVFVQLALPAFNSTVGKMIRIPCTNPWFWLTGLVFSLITSILAGSYPAFYLSSFMPVKVLKGTFKAGRFSSMPRKVLVVLQFAVSITLIIGILIIFKQLEFAKSRTVGYTRDKLIEIKMTTKDIYEHLDGLRTDLLNSGAVESVSQASGSITDQSDGTTNISWEGKDPNTRPLFMGNGVSPDYGKTIKWELVMGRDFSPEYATDSSSIIINEAAARLIGMKEPLSFQIKAFGKPYTTIGVIKDLVKESPFEPVKPTVYIIGDLVTTIAIRLSDRNSVRESMIKIEELFVKHNPSVPFDYDFVDSRYAAKFADEERIGKLAAFFAILATFISALGILGLASFTAEQRVKEIGIKKVLGASVFQLWRMLSKDFVVLVVISFFISVPIAYYFMNDWLSRFEYRTDITWWLLASAGAGALVITLLTVSYQSIKAAIASPIKSLRSE